MKRGIAWNLVMVVALLSCLGVGGCKKKGPTQQAGEKIDKAVEKVDDAINPKGPAEKAGRAVDKALGKDE